MTVEKQARAASGWPMLFVNLVAYAAAIWGMVQGIITLASAEDAGVPAPVTGPALLVGGIVLLIVSIIISSGFFSLQPGQARVLVLFGNYVGTVRESGFYWVNPFYSHSLGSEGTGASIDVSLEEGTPSVKAAAAAAAAKALSTKVSLRARTLNGDRLKVNDKMGNPIEIATVVVWHVADTAKALFDVDHYPSYVSMQTETALRHVASIYAYDHMEDDDASNSSITLRSNIEEVSESLKEELDRRLAPAGVSVDDARLTHLAYAPEIAQAMLRRQQAEAIIAARKKIVEGAVSMVDMALKELSDGGVVEFDDDRKAVMASNLMVVLCGESEAQPVLNTGSLYQ
ncbi:SPFH domain-containing protein [Thermophilibacter sp. ET337]|uniref:SPFH domain-containing protein n=1 Tax=Thermophilibacter sp. ET337 TaxID=2973084 RepID=UPI0021AD2169|nr:SPFH domain-containing protein [Thermophilibacter sp. ET337]MCR8908343.1 SPFH domain-containing protein [Thermophilibacter sp. ET337]